MWIAGCERNERALGRAGRANECVRSVGLWLFSRVLRLASPTSLFAEMTTTCVVLITLPFSVAAGFGDPFSETPGRPLAMSLAALRAVTFRDVTRRKETMCLAVLRCAGAMKISTASLLRDKEKINITFS